MKNKKLKIVIFLILALLAIYAIVNISNSNKVKGFYWKATKGSDSIYLIGTMHISKNEYDYLNDNLKFILDNTEALALEINMYKDEKLKDKIDKDIKEMTLLDKGELKDLLNKEEQEKLDLILEKLDLKYEDISNLSPTGFEFLVSSILYEQSGFIPSGLDEYLAKRYNLAKKDIVSLETHEIQSNTIESITGDFKKWIKDFDVDNQLQQLQNLSDAFYNGDEKLAEAMDKESYNSDKASYNKLLTNRNAHMANKIDELAKSGKEYAVAVGYGHFFGKDSILKDLEHKGYKITDLNK